MTDVAVYLLEIGAHNGTELLTLRVSTGGYITGPSDSPADTEYPDAIIDPGYILRTLFAPGRTMGRGEVGFGDIVISNAEGMFDAWLDYGFDGRSVTLKRLGTRFMAFTGAQTILRATMTRLDSGSAYDTLRLRLYDRRLELDKPLQATRYAGTTLSAGATAEGTANMKDQVKPLVFGRCENVPAICVNPFNLIYQVNDGAVSSITVYDGGMPLTNAGDAANLAALVALTLTGGKYATCLALGLLRLGGSPAFLVTADVTEGSAIGQRYAGAIAQRILAKAGLTGTANINAATFDALNTAAPMELGVFVNDDRNTLDVASDILNSVGAWIAPSTTGIFEVGRFTAPGTPVWTLGEFDVHTETPELIANPDTEGGLPAYGVVLSYRRAWQTQDDANLAQCVSVEQRGFLAAERRTVKAEDSAVLTRHLLAPLLTIDTLLLSQTDAAAEAARRLNLYKVRRDVVTVPARRNDAALAVLGSTGTLTLPRLGYENGRSMVVIGRQENPAREQVELTLWG